MIRPLLLVIQRSEDGGGLHRADFQTQATSAAMW